MKKIIVFILIFSLLGFNIAFANSAEPPSIILLSVDAPDDLMVYFVDGDQEVAFEKDTRYGETTFTLYQVNIKRAKSQRLHLVSSEKDFYLTIEDELDYYNNLFRLDYSRESIKKGKGIFRSIIVVTIRLLMTLIIEGIVFYLFGFRNKHSWLVFIIVNICTQGALNLILLSIPIYTYYLFITLIFLEIFILLFEMVFITYFIYEKDRGYILLCVLVANITSLILGIKIIPVLPF